MKRCNSSKKPSKRRNPSSRFPPRPLHTTCIQATEAPAWRSPPASSESLRCNIITHTSPVAWQKITSADKSSASPWMAPGLAADGTIWGGEFLLAGLAGFERRAHLRAVPLPGGDAAIRHPWRMALSYLRDSLGPQSPDDVACFREVPAPQFKLVDTMLTRRVQTMQTSSCGRLFDAVAAILGMGSEVTFEGQAAIALEMAAHPGVTGRYEFDLQQSEPLVVDLRQTIATIVKEIAKEPAGGRNLRPLSQHALRCDRRGLLPHPRERRTGPRMPERRRLPKPSSVGAYGSRVAASGIWSILTRDGARE